LFDRGRGVPTPDAEWESLPPLLEEELEEEEEELEDELDWFRLSLLPNRACAGAASANVKARDEARNLGDMESNLRTTREAPPNVGTITLFIEGPVTAGQVEEAAISAWRARR
jgi:hypothetical protein